MIGILIMRLVFHKAPIEMASFVAPNNTNRVYHALMHYDHGAITPTGMRGEHLDPVIDWCQQNKCGRQIMWGIFEFDTDEQVVLFLLWWG